MINTNNIVDDDKLWYPADQEMNEVILPSQLPVGMEALPPLYSNDTDPSQLVLGFQDCAAEMIRYLVEVEQLAESSPFVQGLKEHLFQKQQLMNVESYIYEQSEFTLEQFPQQKFGAPNQDYQSSHEPSVRVPNDRTNCMPSAHIPISSHVNLLNISTQAAESEEHQLIEQANSITDSEFKKQSDSVEFSGQISQNFAPAEQFLQHLDSSGQHWFSEHSDYVEHQRLMERPDFAERFGFVECPDGHSVPTGDSIADECKDSYDTVSILKLQQLAENNPEIRRLTDEILFLLQQEDDLSDMEDFSDIEQ